MFRVRRTSPEPRMEMTPLIDVVFLLLTFFVMALVLMVKADVLDVSLPRLSAATRAEPGAAVVVAIDVEGRLFVDGETVELAGVAERIRAARERAPDAKLLVAVDEGGSNATLLALLNELAGEGLTDFAIVGRRAEGR